MELEEIEEVYKQQNETAQGNFIEGLKKKIEKKKVESKYKVEVKRARERYYSSIAYLLKKKAKAKEEQAKAAEEQLPIWDTNPVILEHNWYDKTKYHMQIAYLRSKMFSKNLVHSVYSATIQITVFKVKMKYSKMSKDYHNRMKESQRKVTSFVIKVLETTKKCLAAIVSLLKKIPGKFRKAKAPASEEKKEGEKEESS